MTGMEESENQFSALQKTGSVDWLAFTYLNAQFFYESVCIVKAWVSSNLHARVCISSSNVPRDFLFLYSPMN